MSAEIYYKKAYIKVGDKFIPMVNHGSTNCWELNWRGRHVPEKNWSVLGYGSNGVLFSKTEMESLAKEYEGYSADNTGILKSRNRGFGIGEFEKWILAGMRSALTVEDYVGAGNVLMGYDNATDDTWYIRTTDELLEALDRNRMNTRFHLTFRNNRDIRRPVLELKEEISDKVELQLIGFPQEGILSYPNGKELVLKAIELGVDGIGAIPHYEFTREYSVESLNFITEIAARKQILVDVHCDETDDDSSRGLETLAARTAEIGNGEYVTASHTTAMHSYSEPYMGRLMRVLQKARLNFVANPLVNTNLQGRYDSYPKRRGVTRVNELISNGLNVSFGQDDIRDPWYPMGNGNLRDVVFMGLHVLHLTGYEDIQNSYKFITHNGAKTLHLKNYGINIGNPASFIVYDASSYYDALTNNSNLLYSVRNGNFLVKNI